MPPYLTNIAVWQSFWPIPVLAIVIAIIITFLSKKSQERRELFLVILGFSMLGIVTGYLSGFSRAPALGTVLPSVLSLMGGLVVYLVGRHSTSRVIVSLSIVAFSLTLFIGAEWGAVMRGAAEEYSKSEIYLKKQAFIEAEVNDFRRKLELPPLPAETKPKTP
jgi:hypothetical protein